MRIYFEFVVLIHYVFIISLCLTSVVPDPYQMFGPTSSRLASSGEIHMWQLNVLNTNKYYWENVLYNSQCGCIGSFLNTFVFN